MPKTEKTYPDWVQEYRVRGTTVKKKLTLTDIKVSEYGFSKVLLEICHQECKEAVGTEWEDVLRLIIFRKSHLTNLADDYEMKDPDTFHCSFEAQMGMLEKRIYREYNIK